MKHPKLLPPGREGLAAVKRRQSPKRIKALCSLEQPKPDSAQKERRKPKECGQGLLANRLDCSAGGGRFANDSGVVGCWGRRSRKRVKKKSLTQSAQRAQSSLRREEHSQEWLCHKMVSRRRWAIRGGGGD